MRREEGRERRRAKEMWKFHAKIFTCHVRGGAVPANEGGAAKRLLITRLWKVIHECALIREGSWKVDVYILLHTPDLPHLQACWVSEKSQVNELYHAQPPTQSIRDVELN